MDPNKLLDEAFLSVMGRDVSNNSLGLQGKMWAQHSSQLGIPMPSTDDISNWSVEDVGRYVDKIAEAHSPNPINNKQRSLSECCINEKIDGEAFLTLHQEDIKNVFKIPLGLTIKIVNAIVMLRQIMIKK